MGYTLKNSGSKNSIFTAQGTAKEATSEVVKSSVMAGVLDSSVAKSTDVGLNAAKDAKRPYTGYDNVSIIEGISSTLRGSSSTVTRSPGADRNTRQGIMKTNAVRTVKTATAIRDNLWNPVSGEFTSAPGTANDIAAIRVDGEAIVGRALGGVHNYNYGANVATGIRYPAKTQ